MRSAVRFLCLVLCLFPLAVIAQDDTPPALEGYIAAKPSAGGFDLNGWKVVISPQTQFMRRGKVNGQDAIIADPSLANSLSVGEAVQVFGKKNRHEHTLAAKKIIVQPNTSGLNGLAVIQSVTRVKDGVVLEADGYHILIGAKTKVQFHAPLTQQNAPAATQWVAYSGKLQDDGLLHASHASYGNFVLNRRARKIIEDNKITLNPPDFAANKNGELVIPHLVKAPHGGKGNIPADPAMQQRIQAIGQRLIPAYLRNLAKDDPQKINFRFYAIDDKALHGAVATQTGIVAISVQAIRALQSDSQIAAVLAYGMASVIEWQTVTVQPKQASAVALIALGGMPFVGPVASLAMEGGGLQQMHSAAVEMIEQNARVSLSLMHDAGFDINQAPAAWQGLEGKTGNKAVGSRRSQYLLSIIGSEYTPAALASAGM